MYIYIYNYGSTPRPMYLDMGFETLNLKFCESKLWELTVVALFTGNMFTSITKTIMIYQLTALYHHLAFWLYYMVLLLCIVIYSIAEYVVCYYLKLCCHQMPLMWNRWFPSKSVKSFQNSPKSISEGGRIWQVGLLLRDPEGRARRRAPSGGTISIGVCVYIYIYIYIYIFIYLFIYRYIDI